MRRWLPSPLLSLAVLLLWLLLVADASAGSWLLGATLAVLLPLAGGVLQPQRARFGKGRQRLASQQIGAAGRQQRPALTVEGH